MKTPLLAWWQGLASGHLSCDELYNQIKNQAKLDDVSLDINLWCNLACIHCYYGERTIHSLHREELNLDEYARIIAEFISMGARNFCLTGMEPLLSTKGIQVLEILQQAKEEEAIRGGEVVIGAVSNGTRIKRFLQKLRRVRIDYLDISFDGTEAAHDFLRGQGNFQNSLEGLKLALEHDLAEKVFIASVVHNRNWGDIPRMFQQFAALGVKHFNISPLFTADRRTSSLLFRPGEFAAFVKHLKADLATLRLELKGTEIIIDANFSYLPDLVEAKLIDVEVIRENKARVLYTKEVIEEDINLFFRLMVIPDFFWRSVKISADGDYLGGCESMTALEYWHYAIGNVRDVSVKDLFVRSLQEGSLFHQMIKAYEQSECHRQPCFSLCFGGDPLYAYTSYTRWGRKDPVCQRPLLS